MSELEAERNDMVLCGYLTGYRVDYFKNGIAVDIEWNSKDQTFARDLSAM